MNYDSELDETFLNYMKLCKSNNNMYNNFIKKYIDTDTERYDPNILKNFFKYYETIYEIIFAFRKRRDIVGYFESISIDSRKIFLRYNEKDYNIFQKYSKDIKEALLIYYSKLYEIHSPIIDKFYKHCISVTETPSIENRQPAIITQSIIPLNEDKSQNSIENIKGKLADIPNQYNKQATPYNRNELDPNLLSRLETAQKELGYGGKKYKKKRNYKRTQKIYNYA